MLSHDIKKRTKNQTQLQKLLWNAMCLSTNSFEMQYLWTHLQALSLWWPTWKNYQNRCFKQKNSNKNGVISFKLY
jgi:hypothetical protein